MSQEQLAELLCTKKATISAYENDRIDIKSSIVLEIVAFSQKVRSGETVRISVFFCSKIFG